VIRWFIVVQLYTESVYVGELLPSETKFNQHFGVFCRFRSEFATCQVFLKPCYSTLAFIFAAFLIGYSLQLVRPNRDMGPHREKRDIFTFFLHFMALFIVCALKVHFVQHDVFWPVGHETSVAWNLNFTTRYLFISWTEKLRLFIICHTVLTHFTSFTVVKNRKCMRAPVPHFYRTGLNPTLFIICIVFSVHDCVQSAVSCSQLRRRRDLTQLNCWVESRVAL